MVTWPGSEARAGCLWSVHSAGGRGETRELAQNHGQRDQKDEDQPGNHEEPLQVGPDNGVLLVDAPPRRVDTCRPGRLHRVLSGSGVPSYPPGAGSGCATLRWSAMGHRALLPASHRFGSSCPLGHRSTHARVRRRAPATLPRSIPVRTKVAPFGSVSGYPSAITSTGVPRLISQARAAFPSRTAISRPP